jgi:hypothetical protein
MAEEVWTVQQRLMLSNTLEAMPSQNWNTVHKAMRHFSLLTSLSDEPKSFQPKECVAQQDKLIKDYEDVLKKLLAPNETMVDLKLKPSAYAPISANLRKERLKELRKTIRRRESEIRAVRREIEAVRKGERDGRLNEVRAAMLGIEVEEAMKVEVESTVTSDKMKEKMLMLTSKLIASKISKPFRLPVSAEAVPTYATIIKKPMDLGTITAQIEDGTIQTRFQLVSSILLMCKNATTFNPPGTDLHAMALKLHDLTLQEADTIFGPTKTAGGKERTTRSRASKI